jgi:hypothetical protein
MAHDAGVVAAPVGAGDDGELDARTAHPPNRGADDGAIADSTSNVRQPVFPAEPALEDDGDVVVDPFYHGEELEPDAAAAADDPGGPPPATTVALVPKAPSLWSDAHRASRTAPPAAGTLGGGAVAAAAATAKAKKRKPRPKARPTKPKAG